MATAIDFKLRTCQSDEELMKTLGTDDMLELSLRRLASFVYEARSGDKAGAAHMLGVAPPGGQTDIAPTWLVQAASSHSKLEHQRRERAEAELRQRNRGGGRGGKDGRGGRGRGRGRGAEGANPQA